MRRGSENCTPYTVTTRMISRFNMMASSVSHFLCFVSSGGGGGVGVGVGGGGSQLDSVHNPRLSFEERGEPKRIEPRSLAYLPICIYRLRFVTSARSAERRDVVGLKKRTSIQPQVNCSRDNNI